MNKSFWKYIFLLLFFCILSCKEDIEKKKDYRRGSLTMAVDPSIVNLGTALVDIFQHSYPEAKITIKPEVEDLAIADFVNGKTPMIMVGRDLTKEEADILYNNKRIKYISSQIACDATIFIASKENGIEDISLSEMKAEILAPDSKFVFDGGNSSNFNNILKKLGLSITKNQRLRSFTNSEEVINFISKNNSYIGIIGFNVLSDTEDPKVKEILSKIKILPVIEEEKGLIYPTIPNLRENIYPFTKRIYLLNAENNFKIGSSFARFCGSQRGQLIVTRAGLQPYFIYERRVEVK